MKISVCLATYNGSNYIREQLQSVLPQLGINDEIIISDDHSTDDTLNIVYQINDIRIKVFHNENEKGYSKNFENAITKATGDIIFLCDQDDVWMDNKVKAMVERLKTSSLVMHDAEIVNGELVTIDKSHFERYNVKRGFWINFFKTRYIGACFAFNRVILERAIPFPSNQRLCAYDYWLTIISEYYYKVDLLDTPLIKYRRHGKNASTGGMKSPNTLYHKVRVRLYSMFHLLLR